MPAPEPLPMLRPFTEAVNFQLQRKPMRSDEFYALDDEARRRGFTISGLLRDSSLIEAHRLATASIATGQTKQEFLDELGDVLDLEGTILPRPRLRLIAQNNTAAAYASGRWAQLNDHEITALRPYLMYPLGPDDGDTTPVCRRLQGFVAKHDHPCWRHIAPENHHAERHLQMVSLTEEQARASGRLYEGPEEYPHIDGQTVLPDPGFDRPPQLLASDRKYLEERAGENEAEIGKKDAAGYGLQSIESMRASDFREAPRATAKRMDPATPGEIDRAWSEFRGLVGISGESDSTIVLDEFGSGARITRASFDRMVEAWGAEAPRAFSRILPTLEDPFETWLVQYRNSDGATRFGKRYLGIYRDKQKVRGIALEATQEGWLTIPGAHAKGHRIPALKDLEALRRGLLIRSRGRKG